MKKVNEKLFRELRTIEGMLLDDEDSYFDRRLKLAWWGGYLEGLKSEKKLDEFEVEIWFKGLKRHYDNRNREELMREEFMDYDESKKVWIIS